MNPPARAWTARGGLASFGGEATALLRTLDDTFTRWGVEAGAEQMTFPPLTPSSALQGMDYFHNFPHLGTVVSRIRPDRLDDYSKAMAVDLVPAADIADAGYLLPSAACYSVYLHLGGVALAEPVLITTMAHCFRNEDHYEGLRRLWGFSMREIVCVGSTEAVRQHLGRYHERLTTFLARLGTDADRQAATDPFFKMDSSRAFLQKIDPVKEEYIAPDGTAIASMNYHRNFFGERCGITYKDRPAVTGCVAFGLERWVGVLATVFDGDFHAAREAILVADEPDRSGG